MVANAMENQLMPVQAQLLERAVLEQYNKRWEKGWNKIGEYTENGANLQMDLARKSVTVKKKDLSE